MADDRYRQDYPRQNRPEEHRPQHPVHHQPPTGDPQQQPAPAEPPPATMATSVTLPSMQDSRGPSYGAQPPPPARGYSHDPRYASPNAVNGYPPPHGQQAPGYLPPLQPQPDPRAPAGYAPAEHRGGYYDERRPPPPQYQEQYPPEAYYYRGPPQGHPPNGYPRDYRGPPPGYPPEYMQGVPSNAPPGLPQAAPRQRTSIACRYCRKRKIRCSGYQSAPGGKCQNCARMNQECIFQPVSSSSSTAFIPVSAVPGGVPPGTQLFGAYGQPLAPNSVPAPHSYPPQHAGGPPPPNYYAPMQSPTESYSSFGEPRGDDGSQMLSRRRRRSSEEQEEGYRLPPPRTGVSEEDSRRRSPAEFSNHSSPGGLAHPAYQGQGARQSPRNPAYPQPAAGGRSPIAPQTGSSGASTPARQAPPAASQPQQQQQSASVMSLSNLVDKNDIDKTMINRLNRTRDQKGAPQSGP